MIPLLCFKKKSFKDFSYIYDDTFKYLTGFYVHIASMTFEVKVVINIYLLGKDVLKKCYLTFD